MTVTLLWLPLNNELVGSDVFAEDELAELDLPAVSSAVSYGIDVVCILTYLELERTSTSKARTACLGTTYH